MLEHLHSYFFETPYEERTYARQLVELDEMNPMYWHMLAVSYYKVNEFEDAVSSWEQLFQLHERWGSKWQNPFAYFMLADSYHELGEHEKEGEIINLGASLFPKNGYILSYRAIWALTQNETEENKLIMEDYLSFRHNVTNCPEALISTDFGFLYAKAARLDEAEQKYRLAIQQDPQNPQYQFNLARFLIDEEINVDEGLKIVENLLEKNPDHWNLMHYKGWVLYLKERYEEAVELIRVAWEMKPIYNHLLYMHLQEAEKAIAS
jgi:tetratricopeptide (TPR) repeat protein